MKMSNVEKIIAGVIVLSAFIALNIYITNKLVDSAISQYAQSIPAPVKPIVVDMDAIVTNLTNEGLAPIEVITYTQTLNALLVKEGYLVLDKQNTLSYHPRYALQPIPNDKLLEAAKKAGIDLASSNKEEMEAALNKGRALVNELITPL
jgi:hypothetical protein